MTLKITTHGEVVSGQTTFCEAGMERSGQQGLVFKLAAVLPLKPEYNKQPQTTEVSGTAV